MTSSLAVMAALSTSCDKNTVTPATTAGKASLTVNINGSNFTKASASETSEKQIGNVQIFVFRKNGELDAYASSSEKSGIKLSCTTGEKDIYAIVNAPDLSTLSSRTELLSTKSKLTDNSIGNFVMTGDITKVIGANETLDISVSRIVSRLSVSKVSAKFTSEAYRKKDFKVTRIYATNVAGDINYGLDSSPESWLNKRGYATSSADALLYEDIEDTVITEEQPYTKQADFYVYPNALTSDTDGSDARVTRIVIETTLGGITYYYPILVTGIESNKTYTIRNLTVTRPGSADPDTPVSSEECSFSITVKDWEEGTSQDLTI